MTAISFHSNLKSQTACSKNKKLFAFEKYFLHNDHGFREGVMFKKIGRSFIAFSEASNELLGRSGIFFKELHEERDFVLLQTLFENADGVKLPTSYLRNGKAFVCYDKSLVPQGGFALIEKGPFRSISQIPEAGVLPLDGLFCELTAVCFNRGGSLRRSRFWSFVVGTALSCPAHNIVYAVDTRKTALREQVFNHIKSNTIYEGPVKILEGMNEATTEAIEISNKAQLTRGFLKLALRESRNLSFSSIIQQTFALSTNSIVNPKFR